MAKHMAGLIGTKDTEEVLPNDILQLGQEGVHLLVHLDGQGTECVDHSVREKFLVLLHLRGEETFLRLRISEESLVESYHLIALLPIVK